MGYNEEGIVRFLKNLRREDLNSETLSSREKRLFDLVSAVVPETIEQQAKLIMSKMMSLQMPLTNLPLPSESSVITTENEKSAALLFDRVWTPYIKDVPQEIGFFGNSDLEIDVWTCIRISDIAQNFGSNEALRDRIVVNSRRLLEMILASEVSKSKEKDVLRSSVSEHPFTTFVHLISSKLNSKHGLNVKTLFPTKTDQDLEYSAGDQRVIFACLNGIAIPDEKALSWRQIMELRQDKDTNEKLRKLIHWLDREMVGKSTSFIKDEINEKLESYEWAIRKHGIRTIVGSVGKLLDYKTLIEAAIAFGIVTHSGTGIDPLLATSGFVAGKAVVEITDRYLDRKDLNIGPGSEISYLYELRRK